MAYKDLREFLDRLEKEGELKRINGAHWNLEIGGITEVSLKKPNPPALVFDNIPGYPKGFRVASNLVNTHRRSALALGLPEDASPLELVRLWKDRIRKIEPIPPRVVKEGAILQNFLEGERVNMLAFPSPFWHEHDGGRYLGTADMVIQADLDAPDWINVGTYRVQVHDEKHLGLYISRGHHGWTILEKYWARGKPCPVAITFGQEPATWIGITHALPDRVSEYDYAGWIRGEPVEVLRGPVTGLPIPAHAEIAIEGWVHPETSRHRIEGPFGEWQGYYASEARPEPVVDVAAILYRNDPIITGAPPLKPTATRNPQIAIDFGSARIWDYLEKAGVPEVKGVFRFISGQTSAYFIVVSIRQRYPGHSRQAAHAALGCYGGANNGRFVIVVDDDIDPSNVDEVLWAVGTRCDAEAGIDVVKGCWGSALDPRLEPWKKKAGNLVSSRAILDACRPYHWFNEFPRVSTISKELEKTIREKWEGVI
ncbi:MAG TPA: UbiD family decarboxylase [bacterium]|nr:UbiD family decarboxylase [bacterium]